MLGPLQGLRAGNEGAPADRAARQAKDLVRRQAADRRRPGRILRLAVAAAEEIGLECLPADAAAVEEGAVVPPLGDQGVRQPQHQCDIGAGADRVPDRLDPGRQVVAQGRDQVEFRTAPARRLQIAAGDVLAGAAAADIVVFERHAAKGQHQRALADQFGPADIAAGDRPLRADDMRQDHRRRPRAVAVDRADIAAGQVQKAVELVLRVVKAAGAGPAVGAAEHRARPVRGVDPAQLRDDEVERLGPGNRHQFVAPPPCVGARTPLQPAAPHHRPGDPRPMRYRGRDVAEQGGGIAIARMRHDLDAGLDAGSRESTENAPQCELCGTPRLLVEGSVRISFISKPVRYGWPRRGTTAPRPLLRSTCSA